MGRVNMMMLAVLAICACGLSDASYDSPPSDMPSTPMYRKKMHRHRTTTPMPTTAETLPTTSIAADLPLSSAVPATLSSFSCADLDPGMYPAGACKNFFYVCEPEADNALVFDCASPDTFFDETSGFCLEKAYVSGCGGIATTTAQPLLASSEIPFAFDCSLKEDGDYAQEKECSKWYVSCSGGESTYRNCPADTYFDIESGECLEKEWVPVCGGELTTRMPETTVASDAGFDCADKADGYYGSDSCSPLFYSCSGGHARAMKCAGHASQELKFDVDSQMCMLARYVLACGGEATTTTPNPPRASLLPQISCKDKAPGVYEDPTMQRTSAGVCSSLYIICLPDAVDAIVNECPKGTKYDITVDQCQYDWNVTACGKVDKIKPRTASRILEDEPVTEAAYTSKPLRTTRYMKPTTEATTTTIADVPSTEASYTTKAAKRRHHKKTTTTEATTTTTTTMADEPVTDSYTTKKYRPNRRTTTLSTTTELPSTTPLEDETELPPSTEASYTTKKFRPTRRTTIADVPSTSAKMSIGY